MDICPPIKFSKTVYPTTTLTFLGLELVTVKFKIRLPEDKLVTLRSEVQKISHIETTTVPH